MQLSQDTRFKKDRIKKYFRPRTHPFCKFLCEEATITQNLADRNYLLLVKRNILTVASFAEAGGSRLPSASLVKKHLIF